MDQVMEYCFENDLVRRDGDAREFEEVVDSSNSTIDTVTKMRCICHSATRG